MATKLDPDAITTEKELDRALLSPDFKLTPEQLERLMGVIPPAKRSFGSKLKISKQSWENRGEYLYNTALEMYKHAATNKLMPKGWKPGDEYTPAKKPDVIRMPGQKRKISLDDALRRHFENNPLDLDGIAKTVVTKAKRGEYNFVKLVFDRLDGGTPQRIDLRTVPTAKLIEIMQNVVSATADNDMESIEEADFRVIEDGEEEA